MHGYWMFSDANISFSFEVSPDDMLSRELSSGSQVAEIPEGLEYIQSSEQAFYYVNPASIEGLNLEHGDWFVSTCGSNVSGSRQYLGEVIDMPVMGSLDPPFVLQLQLPCSSGCSCQWLPTAANSTA